MNLSAIAIRRPVFTVMVMVALMVLGIFGYRSLGTDLFPDVSFPVVTVNVVYRGASPSEVETQVTKPIEDVVVSLNGIDRVRSLSRESLHHVHHLRAGHGHPGGRDQVRERVAQTRFKLPARGQEPAISRLDVSLRPSSPTRCTARAP
jgi:HAE1 family hydrophobic/amphiphilic exporter-1